MYDYISGKIASKSPTQAVIDIAGVGYKLNISIHTYSEIENKEQAKLYVSQIVREDDYQLYGFAEILERSVFDLLISVSGIGPNTARITLSSMTPEETRDAILSENELAFKKVKGVGPKTAKRIIIDLKDKMLKLADGSVNLSSNISSQNKLNEEANAALISLGFNKAQVQKALNKITDAETVEELIKKALKALY